ncbi:RNA-directed DNA polymerase, eukaryota, partial [Tanacetum coccineum]
MGFDEWQEVSRRGYKKSSKQDDVARISTSIYVTNFPISFTAKDLYHTCKQYGHVVDSFIPVKKAKDGKRFGFVKFINVFNVERLVNNLCTIWIGRLKLHANVARFSRESKKDSNLSEQRTNEMCNSKVQEGNKGVKDSGVGKSYVNVVQGNVLKGDSGNSPAIVLDDDCGNDVDLSRHVFGKVKDFNSINNLKLILAKEGFEEVNLSYMGGLWVMIELHNVESQKDLLSHPGVRSWFQDLVAAYADFFSKERIVWVDVEGIPLNAWSSNTFSRIGNKWGEVMDIEESTGSSFSRKRDDYSSDEDTSGGDFRKPRYAQWNDMETVPRYIIVDPFGIYDILNKNTVKNVVPDPSLSHPPGFTPVQSPRHPLVECLRVREMSPIKQNGDTRIDDSNINTSESINDFSPNIPSRKTSKGGSMLDVLDDLIKVGKSMGYVMEGCSKDFEHIISSQGFGLDLKKISQSPWINNQISLKKGIKSSLLNKLADIDKVLDSGVNSDEILLSRLEVSRRLFNLNEADIKDAAQQAKVKWAIEGDENSKFFHGVINKKRAQLAIRGVFNNGTWCTNPNMVKESFLSHFASRFKQPGSSRFKINLPFINRLTTDQRIDLDCAITSDEIKAAVWDCGENKSPGPDGFTFEFFRHFLDIFANPLAPLLFILVMESLHLSVCRVVNDGIFKGLQLQDHMTLSHLFYADDVV